MENHHLTPLLVDSTMNSAQKIPLVGDTPQLVVRHDTPPLGIISWGTLDGEPPPDTPLCGFYNELCLEDTTGR